MIIIIIILVLIGAAALFLLYGTLKEKVQFQGDGWYESVNVKSKGSLTENLSGLEPFASTRKTEVSSLAESWVYGNDMQIYDGKYYFIETSHGSAIAVYEETSGNTRYYNKENVRIFLIFDQKLYVNYLDGTEEKISVHNLTDGSRIPFFG